MKNTTALTVILNIHTINIYSTLGLVSSLPPTVSMKSLPYTAVLVRLKLSLYTVNPGMYKLYFHTETPAALGRYDTYSATPVLCLKAVKKKKKKKTGHSQACIICTVELMLKCLQNAC